MVHVVNRMRLYGPHSLDFLLCICMAKGNNVRHIHGRCRCRRDVPQLFVKEYLQPYVVVDSINILTRAVQHEDLVTWHDVIQYSEGER